MAACSTHTRFLSLLCVLCVLCSLRVVLPIGPASAAETPGKTATTHLSPREIAEKIAPAVVLVTAEGPREKGLGSGFFVDPHGAIATALHVVDGAQRLSVTLADGQRIENVGVRAFDVEKDLAVLQAAAPAGGKEMMAGKLGKPSSAQPGDPILVVSNPLGLQRTVTEGIVSAWREAKKEGNSGRDDESEAMVLLPSCRLLQISASISPGSSGGPVVDQRGEVIGVATSGMEYGVAGLNFAVPVDELPSLLAAGEPMDLRTFQKRLDDVRLDLARPHFESAEVALDSGRRQEGIRHLERAILLFPGYQDALLLSSRLLAEEGNVEKALERAERAIRANEENADAWTRAGSLYAWMARSQSNPSLSAKAEAAFQKALALDGRQARAALGLAMIRARQGSLDQAEELLRQAVAMEPDLADAWFMIGEIRFTRRDPRQAEEAYKKAIWANSDHARSHLALGMLYINWDSGYMDHASRHLTEFLRIAGDDPALAEEREIARRLVETYFHHLVNW